MSTEVTRAEFDELAEEVTGEKVVTRHILEQTRRNSDDLAVLKTRVARVEEKVDAVDRKVGDLDRKVGDLDHKVDGLAEQVSSLVREIPGVVRDAMRDVFRERGRKK